MRLRFRPSISTTIFGAFVTMALLTAVVGAYGLVVLRAAGGFVVDLYDRPLMAVNFDRAASLDFVEMDKELIRQQGANEDRAEIDARIARLAKTFDEDLAIAEARSLSGDEKKIIGEIGELVGRWHALRRSGAGRGTGSELDRLAGHIIERFDMLVETAVDHSFVERRKVVSAIELFKIGGSAALLAALILATLVAAVLVRRIIKPLRGAAAIADHIAAGELQTPIPDGGPDETGMLLHSLSVMQQSIHEMVEREKAQRRSAQNRLVEAIESAHEAIILVGADQRIVIANSQLANFFPTLGDRLGPGAIFDETFRDVGQLLGFCVAPEEQETAAALERELLLPDRRWVRVSRSKTQEGGFFLLISDISDIKAREERLREAQHAAEAASAAKSSFLANMSHELRTPLNAILGFSEIMSSELLGRLGNRTYVQYARDIWQSGSHLLDIINSVLDLSKSEAGKLQLACETVNLQEIVESSAAMMRDQCLRAGLRLGIDMPDAPLEVWADPAKMRQVLLNLLSNAVKFTEPGGTVGVTAGSDADGSAFLRVADTGIGMSVDEIPTALAPFGQVDNRLSRRYEGTGLGLPLSKAIVELHRGEIIISSQPGRGTTVTVSLPQVAKVIAEAA